MTLTRRKRAHNVLVCYSIEAGIAFEGRDLVLRDLLADLMHYADTFDGFDFDAELEAAREFYLDEIDQLEAEQAADAAGMS